MRNLNSQIPDWIAQFGEKNLSTEQINLTIREINLTIPVYFPSDDLPSYILFILVIQNGNVATQHCEMDVPFIVGFFSIVFVRSDEIFPRFSVLNRGVFGEKEVVNMAVRPHPLCWQLDPNNQIFK